MEVFKTIGGVKSRIQIWDDPFYSGGKDVIICITGNPGIIDFYYEFCSELSNSTGLPLCLIGQAGHDIFPDQLQISIKHNGHLFDLTGQINHKVDLINNVIDKECNIHLIGHSIGAWLIIEILKNHPEILRRVLSVNLLFPTIKEMAATTNGCYINNVIRKCNKLIMYLLVLLQILPTFIHKKLIRLYLIFVGLPMHYTNRLLKYTDPNIMEKVLFLAYKEMDKVRKLNVEGMQKIKQICNVIYGERDGWVPLYYMTELEQFQPQLQMIKVPYPHDFVLRYSKEVAKLVKEFITPRLMKK
ncbi:hypothetical protein ACJJTC_012705 [Scirpophaga incertulas]